MWNQKRTCLLTSRSYFHNPCGCSFYKSMQSDLYSPSNVKDDHTQSFQTSFFKMTTTQSILCQLGGFFKTTIKWILYQTYSISSRKLYNQSITKLQTVLQNNCIIYPLLHLKCSFKTTMQSNHTFPQHTPQWGAVDAEIKVPFDENTELKGSTFKVVF